MMSEAIVPVFVAVRLVLGFVLNVAAVVVGLYVWDRWLKGK